MYTVASSKLNCFLKDKAALFGAFSPAGLTSSAIEAVSYTLADGETVSLKAMSEPVESAGSGTSEAASDSTAYQTVWRLENDPTADLDTDKNGCHPHGAQQLCQRAQIRCGWCRPGRGRV